MEDPDMNEATAMVRKDRDARSQAVLLPPVDVVEDAAGITLFADLPGVPKDRLNLQIEDGTLTIEGEVALQVPEGMEPTHAEVSLPRYRRAFTLSKELDVENVKAELNHGVLELRIPKAAHAQPKRIEVQGG
jgi:HSP20 family molecular chaperone IbpA